MRVRNVTTEHTPKPKTGLNDRLLLIIEVPAVIILVVMMVHVVINAISRSGFGSPIFATLELTQHWYLPSLVLLGLVAAQARNEHIVADLLFDSFPAAAKKWVTVLVNVLTAVVAFGIAWFGLQVSLHSIDRNITAGNTDIPMWPIEMLLAVCYAVFGIQLVFLAVQVAMKGVEAFNDPDGIPNDDGVGIGDDPIQREEEAEAREQELAQEAADGGDAQTGTETK